MMTATEPRIYVACLAAYNAGRLHGRWIDAAQDPEDLHAQIREMLAGSPISGAEEWAIHDHEGFAGIRISEHESIERVAALAAALEEHGAPFAAYYDNDPFEDVDALVESFEEAYQGAHYSEEAFAEDLADDIGALDMLKEAGLADSWPFTCIDWEMAARDLFLSGDYWSAPGEGGYVYVFRSL